MPGEPDKQELHQDEIRSVLDAYPFGYPSEWKRCSQGYANRNYRVSLDAGDFLYRICTSQTLENTERETRLNHYLHEQGIPVAPPIARSDGALISPSPAGPVVLYPFLEGSTPDYHPENVRVIARAAAQLNQLPCPETLSKTNTVGVEAAHNFIARTRDHPYPDRFRRFALAFEALYRDLDHPDDRVLVHGDLFRDNTLFQGHELVAILDFEEYCLTTRMFEIGVLVNGFCSPENRPDLALVRVLLASYHAVSPLTGPEVQRLPSYARWGALCMIFWHLRCLLDAPDPRKVQAIDGHFERLSHMKNMPTSL